MVVKAQVHSGGRGKAGGVKLAKTPEEAREHASRILGMEIKGLKVMKVLVTPAEDIATEAYVGVLMDRKTQAPTFMVSAEGGIDIEEVAATNPEAIRKLAVDPRYGLLPHQALLAGERALRRSRPRQAGVARSSRQLYKAFVDSGASMAEINPLISTKSGEIKAIDAKMSIDDTELFRRPEVAAMRDTSDEPAAETKARDAGLSFVKLDGNVGCCVNGAGLAMATMDLVKYYGGEPANFLDIGGSSNPDKVIAALEIITADPNVKVDPLQHLRGNHPLRRRGQRHRGGHQAHRHQAPHRHPAHGHQRGAGHQDPRGRRLLRLHLDGRGGGEGRGAGKGIGDHVDLHRQGHEARRPGHHRTGRLVPHPPDDGVRHAGRGRRDPRQGRPDLRGARRTHGPHLQHHGRGRGRTGRQHLRRLRAAGVRGRTRSWRPPTRA